MKTRRVQRKRETPSRLTQEEFDRQMDEWWKLNRWSAKQRNFVESDPEYIIHCKYRDVQAAMARAIDALRDGKVQKEVIEANVFSQMQKEIASWSDGETPVA